MKKKDSIYKVEVDNKASFQIDWRNLGIDIYDSNNKSIGFLKDQVNYKAELLSFDLKSKEMKVAINGVSHTVLIKDDLDMRIEKMGLETTLSTDIKELVAPMPGQVKEILVKAGDSVEEGDPLLVLVAMKMENLLKSPQAGIIQTVNITDEDIVNKSDVLVTFQ